MLYRVVCNIEAHICFNITSLAVYNHRCTPHCLLYVYCVLLMSGSQPS